MSPSIRFPSPAGSPLATRSPWGSQSFRGFFPAETAVGRGGRSILANLGLSKFAAETPARYSEIATAAARDLPALSEPRFSLRTRLEQSPLRDDAGRARDLEAAFRQMWRAWCGKME